MSLVLCREKKERNKVYTNPKHNEIFKFFTW